GWRRYSSEALALGAFPLGYPRSDLYVAGGGGYRYRGRFHVGVEYRYSAQLSNSFGQTLLRHRVAVSGGVALPVDLLLLAQAALQSPQFPDQIFLSQDLLLAAAAETLSSVSVKLPRPMTSWLERELRYGLYQGVLPNNGLRYLRHTAPLGATVRWPP